LSFHFSKKKQAKSGVLSLVTVSSKKPVFNPVTVTIPYRPGINFLYSSIANLGPPKGSRKA